MLYLVWFAFSGPAYAGLALSPPVVSDIAGQEIEEGGSFETIALDTYVSDDDTPLHQLIWTAVSTGDLTIQISSERIATIIIPSTDWNGAETITFTATDPDNQSDSTESEFTVTAVNDAPVAENDSESTNEDTPVTIDVLENDSDIENDALTIASVTQGGHGAVTINADNTLTFTPVENYYGPDSFTYKVNDGTVDSNAATVAIVVKPVNDPPGAVGDTWGNIDEDVQFDAPAPGVLSNDGDVDLDALTAELVDGPSHGTLTLNANGSFSYTSHENYNGPDSFTYKAHDGTVYSDSATVSLTVKPVNDAPETVDDTYENIVEDVQFDAPAPGVLSNDSDTEDDGLTAVLVAGPSHGNLTLNSDGSFSYTSHTNYNGPDSFTYKTHDGTADGNTATVSITVTAANDAPVAVADADTTNEDTPVTIDVLTNDSDLDGDSLTVHKTSDPANGSIVINANGSVTYTPSIDYYGPDSFKYKANDGTDDSDEVTVSITVDAVNDPPIAGDLPTQNKNEDENPWTVNLSPFKSDVDNDNVDLDWQISTIAPPLVTAQIADTDNDVLEISPVENAYGPCTITLILTDTGGLTDTTTMTVTLDPANDTPAALDDAWVNIDEDVQFDTPAPGVLSNDSDVDFDVLTAELVDGPSHGTLTLYTNGSFSYTSHTNYNGPDSFTYKAHDGTVYSDNATVSLTVKPVNDAPETVDDTYENIVEDVQFDVPAPGVLGNDSDTEEDGMTAVLVAGPSHGNLTLNSDGSFSYVSHANYNGPDSFTYKAHDGTADGNTATVSITVDPVNDPPVAVGDTWANIQEDVQFDAPAPGVLGNDSDVELDVLTAERVDAPSHGTLTLNANGSFSYTSHENYNGPDSFSYKAHDGTAYSGVVTVSITVKPVNDPPVAAADAAETKEDEAVVINVLENDSDPIEMSPLTPVITVLPENGSLKIKTDGIQYTPASNFNGEDSFKYRASDGTDKSEEVTVSITVNAVNDAPVIYGQEYLSTPQNTPFTITPADVMVRDIDLTYPHDSRLEPVPGTYTLTIADGDNYSVEGLSIIPDQDFQGYISVPATVNDGLMDSNEYTVKLVVGDAGKPCSMVVNAPSGVEGPGNIIISYTADDVFTGEICGNAHSGSGVAHVTLYVKGPADEDFDEYATDTGNEIDNSFHYEMIEEGRYYFYTRATDREDNYEDAPLAGFDADIVYAVDFSGYAILAVGDTTGSEDQSAYGLLANNIYGHMLNRNFSLVESAEDPLDHIKYFNPDNPAQTGVDDYSQSGAITYKEALEEAVTQWAYSKIDTLQGPLYIVLTGGGGPLFEGDGLALTSNEYLTAAELHGWLNILEDDLSAKHKDLQVIIVLGFDNSGSFISDLSRTGRAIVTSTAERGMSYPGPDTPDGDREGDLFLANLFNQWSQTVTTSDGDLHADLNSAFEITVRQVEVYTDRGDDSPAFPYFDTARQHPFLDDNGKAPGTHDLNPTGAALDSVFNRIENYETVSGALSSISADFNGDGHDDLAVVNTTSPTISIFLSNDDRSFTRTADYDPGEGSIAVSTGDFNGDNHPDLAVVDSLSGDIALLIGDGAGGFVESLRHNIGGSPRAIVSADINGDDILDLAITDADVNGVRILIGDGNTGFTENPDTVYKSGISPLSIAAVDFNGDGKLDLAVANTGDCLDSETDCERISEADNDTAECADDIDVFPFDSSECTDVDGDGIGDNTDTDDDNDGMPNTWEETHGLDPLDPDDANLDPDEDGITNLTEYGIGTDPGLESTTDDIDTDNDGTVNSEDEDDDNDGHPDLTDAFPYNSNEWKDSDLDNTGDNADPDDDNDGMPDVWEAQFASLNPALNDAHLDPDGDDKDNLNEYLAGTDPELSTGGNVAVLLGASEGSFQTAVYYALGNSPSGVAAGDFNRDNRPDLAVVERDANQLTIFTNMGNASFENSGDYATDGPPAAIAAGHFNSDDFIDIAVVNPDADGVHIYKGTETGKFPIRRKYNTGKFPISVVSGGFSNGDAYLAVTNLGSSSLSILSRQVIDDENRPNDGDFSKTVIFGYPVTKAEADANLPESIRFVEAGWAPENSGIEGDPLAVGQSSAVIWANMDPLEIDRTTVWVTIRPPRASMEQDTDPILLEWTEENGRFETTYTGFTLPGRYQLFFSAQFDDGFITSVVPPDAYSHQASIFTNTYQLTPYDRYLHKQTGINTKPHFNSYLNAQGQAQVNVGSGLLLAWSSASDDDRDDKKRLTYNVEILVQGTREFSQTGIKDNFFIFPASVLTQLGNDQIMEIRIIAVDEYGKISDPMVAVTKADNSTGTPLDGLLRGFIYNKNQQAVTEGHIIIPGKEPRKIRTGGYYLFPLPVGTYMMIVDAPEYEEYVYVPVEIEEGGITTLNFKLTATKDTIDSDGDGVLDIKDNCPDTPNPEQTDVDNDGIGDICDPCLDGVDSDNDGVEDCIDDCPLNFSKIEPGVCGCLVSDIDTDGDTIPDCKDTDDDGDGDKDDEDDDWRDDDGDDIHDDIDDDDDNDGMPDEWEEKYGLDPLDPKDADEDPDNDGSKNLKEFLDGTDPTVHNDSEEDADGDGIPDYLDPFDDDPDEWEDTDNDGIGNNEDTDDDGDGIPDTWEIEYGLDPLNPHDAAEDPDNDGDTNLEEYLNGTHPTNLLPDQPTVLSPYDGEAVSTTTPLLSSGPFSDPDALDEHSATRWQIGLDADFEDLAMDITTSDHLTSLEVPVFILAGGTTYHLRILHMDGQEEASPWSESITFSITATTGNDDMADVVPDDQKVDDLTIDRDNNGQPDIEQSDMACVLGASTEQIICMKTSTNVLAIDAMMWIDPDTIEDTKNRPISLPMGLVSFKLSVPPGTVTTITIYLPAPAPMSVDWYKWDLIDGWQNFAYFAHFSDDRMSVTFKLRDGGIGDSDGAENGSIVDPSGTGTTPAGIYRSYSGIEGNSQMGCFIDSVGSNGSKPTLFLIMLLSMGLFLCIIAPKKK